MKISRFYFSAFLSAFALGKPVVFQSNEQDLAPLLMAPTSGDSTPIPDSFIVKLKSADANSLFSTESSVLSNHQSWLTGILASSAAESSSVHSFVSDFFEFEGFIGYAGKFSNDLLAQIRNRPDVEYIEQDKMIYLNDNNDQDTQDFSALQEKITEKNASWGLGRIAVHEKLTVGSDVDLTYDYTYDAEASGQDVTVYVIDTGINIHHEEFIGRAKWGKTFAWFSSDEDANGHGTHCAGIIGGTRFGVAKNVSLVAVKVLSDQGAGAISWIIAGISYVVKEHLKRDFPIIGKIPPRRTIASMSLGGGFTRSLNDAVDKATKNGVLFTVAAGNEDSDACKVSPASSEFGITVGASDRQDNRAFFSNWGSCVDIFAPGHKIYSAFKNGTNGYALLSGTSMATPFVAGVAATLWTTLPADTKPDVLKTLLIEAATKNALADVYGSPNALLFNQQQ